MFPPWYLVNEMPETAIYQEWYPKVCFSYELVVGEQSVPCPIIGFTHKTLTLRSCGGDITCCSRKELVKRLLNKRQIPPPKKVLETTKHTYNLKCLTLTHDLFYICINFCIGIGYANPLIPS